MIANLSKAGAFLSFDWLEHLNLVIDWNVNSEERVCDEHQKCKRLWSELYKHLKHPTTLSTIKFKDGRNNLL